MCEGKGDKIFIIVLVEVWVFRKYLFLKIVNFMFIIVYGILVFGEWMKLEINYLFGIRNF